MKAANILLAAALAQTGMAHYIFNQLIVGDKTTDAYEYVRKNTNMNSPVTDVTSKDMICNVGGSTAGAAAKVASVAAGSTVGFKVDTPVQHPGPLNVYMSKADGDVKSYDGSGDWFKVYEMGPNKVGDNGLTFLADKISEFTFKLPTALPSGQYLLRVEHIGLHQASSFGGAQFYIECAQLEVTGGGSGKPGPTVKFPGAYTGHEEGIELSIYYPIPTNYQVPGPAVWGGASSGDAPASSAASSKAPASTVSSKAPASSVASSKTSVTTNKLPATTMATSVKPSATSGSGAANKKYAQCGGNGWSGSTECESGSTCKSLNDYYSQCV